MARYERSKSKSGYYHVMIRGNERKNIFSDEQDRSKFIDVVHKMSQGNTYTTHAYCLMDNHVHFLISEGTDSIAKTMKRISVSYAYYFNKKYRRVGHLFQDRFRSEPIEDDSQLLAVTRYIHLNPVVAGIVKKPEKYKWSSYSAHIGEKEDILITDRESILGIISKDQEIAIKEFKRFTMEEQQDSFIDTNDKEVVEVSEADIEKELRTIFKELRIPEGTTGKDIPIEVVHQLKSRTGLSIRKLAEILKMNKNKVNKILKNKE